MFGQESAGEIKLEPYKFEVPNQPPVEAERGFLTVRENRQNPQSRLIQIAFVRFKSTSASPGSPIVYLAGGPGGSGISAARNPARFPMFMALREIGDVIALDQRGVGQSRPNLGCLNSLDLPLERVVSEAEYLQTAIELSMACHKYWHDQGVDLTGYNTVENAADIEDLREALGARKLNLLGISYGTHLGLTILKNYGRNIDHAILAGVEGPDHTYKLPGNLERQLGAISAELKTDAELSAKIPNFSDLMKRVFERVQKEPPTVEFTDPRTQQKQRVMIGDFDLRYLTAALMGDTPAISQLPALYYAMDQGDFSLIAPQIAGLRKRGIGTAMMFMMDCASGISRARRERIDREIPGTVLGALIDFPFPGICRAWNQRDLGDEFRRDVKSDVPTLFISGTLDGRTPVSNAEETRRGFAKSEHLIIARAGHSDDLFASSPEIVKVMVAFLRNRPISSSRITLPPLSWRKI
jgi:pimeloyl-ACP methyl ester carboxylesterase